MKTRILISILVCGFLLTACQPPQPQEMNSSGLENDPTPTSSVVIIEPTPVNPVFGPDSYPPGMDPLTGLQVTDQDLLDRCPMLIKVSNYPRSGRPHAGLSQADLVFEYYIGEGMNRFVPVFYGQDAPRVGPIRSGRLADVQLVSMYQGILAFKGAWYKVNEAIYSTLKNRAITGSPATCPAVCDDGPESVISMYANTAELAKYAVNKGICDGSRPALAGMVFSEEIPADGRDAPELAVNYNAYNRGEWHYDDVSGSYLRWIESVSGEEGAEIIKMIPLLDAGTGMQLAFKNVVILFARHDIYAETYFDIELQKNTSGARAILFRDGDAFDGVWKSAGEKKPLQFFTPEGEYLPFKPGNSWLVIVGSRSIITTPLGEMWELTDHLP